MDMPGLDGTAVNTGKIDFPESFEIRTVSTEHVHDLSSLVGDLFERSDDDSIDVAGFLDLHRILRAVLLRVGLGMRAFHGAD